MRCDFFRAALAVVVAIAASTLTGAAQSPPSFQFVSLRRTAPAAPTTGPVTAASRAMLTVLPGGRFEARGVTLDDLVRVVYGYEQRNPRHGVIESGVSWTTRDTFDVTAAIEGEWTRPPTGQRVPAELRLLLKGLLEDRFALKARIQTKRLDVYALRRIKGERPTPGLRNSRGECVGPFTDPTSIEAAGKPPCPFRVAVDCIEAGSITMIQFADVLTTRGGQLADRPIVDDTGHVGTYDVVLTTGLRPSVAVNQPLYQAQANAMAEFTGTVFGDSRWGPAVRRALQEQLGLELQPTRLPVPSLRIEGARKPSED